MFLKNNVVQKMYFLFILFHLKLPKVFGQVRVAVKGTGRTLIQVFRGDN
jgi:hypothetical protein